VIIDALALFVGYLTIGLVVLTGVIISIILIAEFIAEICGKWQEKHHPGVIEKYRLLYAARRWQIAGHCPTCQRKNDEHGEEDGKI
jgi:hypothetical protein